MTRPLLRRLFRALGLEVRRAEEGCFPYLRECLCDGVRFPFWIANRHAAEWWSGEQVRFDAEMQFLKRSCKPGALVVEVGAHHGMHTVQLARWIGPHGRVHAFELDAGNAQVLSANIGINHLSQVEVFHAAVGDREGALVADGERVAVAGRSVPAVTLDSHLGKLGNPRVDLLKIDVEGFEGRVLEGARSMLAVQPRPNLAIELHLDDLGRYGDSLETVVGSLRLSDYHATFMVRPDWNVTRILHSISDLPTSGGVVNLFLEVSR